MSSLWDDWDLTDVPVLTVERIWVAWRAQTLLGAILEKGRWTENDWGELCGLLGLWLGWFGRPGDERLLGGCWTPGGLLWPRSLTER